MSVLKNIYLDAWGRTKLRPLFLLGIGLFTLMVSIGAFQLTSTMIENSALAAGRGMFFASPLKSMSVEEKAVHASTLKSLVSEDASTLSMLIGEEVELVFLSPELKRQEGLIRIWQYRSDSCVLDIYFNAAEGTGAQTPVSHYEIRARQKALLSGQTKTVDVQEQSCINSILPKSQNIAAEI